MPPLYMPALYMPDRAGHAVQRRVFTRSAVEGHGLLAGVLDARGAADVFQAQHGHGHEQDDDRQNGHELDEGEGSAAAPRVGSA
jgi:hypothetical protein